MVSCRVGWRGRCELVHGRGARRVTSHPRVNKKGRKRRVWFGPDWVREKACASGKAINGNTLGFGANFLFRDNWFRHTLVESGSEAELAG